MSYPLRLQKPYINKLQAKVVHEDNHWMWGGDFDRAGSARYSGESVLRNFFIYYRPDEPIPERCFVKTTCGVKGCVNPWHAVIR